MSSLPSMRFIPLMLLLLLLLAPAATAAPVPPPECKRECGGVAIPYPFGLKNDASESCYLHRGFRLTCNDSFSPPKPFQGDTEVVSVSLPSSQMTILLNLSYSCYNAYGYNNYGLWTTTLASPYTLSPTSNIFMAIGCDTLAKFKIGDNNNFAGCISGCNDLRSVTDGNCTGIGCCEASIPPGVRWIETAFVPRDNNSLTYRFNPCSYSFIVQKGNYSFKTSELRDMASDRSFPVILDFAVANTSCEVAQADRENYLCASSNSQCIDAPSGDGYSCSCSPGYEGNPYLPDGCQDIDECKLSRELYPCYGNCINVPGNYSCICPKGFSSDNPKKEKCIEKNDGLSPASKALLGVGLSVLLLALVGSLACVAFQRRKILALRRKYFEYYGGAFLEQKLPSDGGAHFRLYPLPELRAATANFHKDRILGAGGFGTVYKGTLSDAHRTTVAIKKPNVANEKNGRDFANEILILSRIFHCNVVELLGCCLEAEVPMLVYKFIPNGTLYHYLHAHRAPIPFATRLRIATEAANALKYLHADASTPILHGDVKTLNILLDERYTVKVSDFGTSRLSPKDKMQFTTMVQGTYGYLDPEYVVNGHLTDKSDVYSFGVVLLELMTRRRPFENAAREEERSLAAIFLRYMEYGREQELLDPEIMVEVGTTPEVMEVLNLAMWCLNLKASGRPNMRKVLSTLEAIRVPEARPWAPPGATNSYVSPSSYVAGTYSYELPPRNEQQGR